MLGRPYLKHRGLVPFGGRSRAHSLYTLVKGDLLSSHNIRAKKREEERERTVRFRNRLGFFRYIYIRSTGSINLGCFFLVIKV